MEHGEPGNVLEGETESSCRRFDHHLCYNLIRQLNSKHNLIPPFMYGLVKRERIH